MNKRPRRLFGEICMCIDPTIWPDLTIEIEKASMRYWALFMNIAAIFMNIAAIFISHAILRDIARYCAISRDIHEYRRDIVRYIFDEYRREYRELTQITHFLYAPPSFSMFIA